MLSRIDRQVDARVRRDRLPFRVLDDRKRQVLTGNERQPGRCADGVLRDHRLAVGLYRAEGTKLVRTERVELDVSGARTEVPELVVID